MLICKNCRMAEVARSPIDIDEEDVKQDHTIEHTGGVQKDTEGKYVMSDGLFV